MTVEAEDRAIATRRAPRVIWIGLSLALAICLVAALWSPIARLLGSCSAVEEGSFPGLEQVAAQTLREVDYDLSRYSGCEDTGEPGASVRADVLAWTSRSEAEAFLEERGWTLEHAPNVYRSADGQYRAQVVMQTEESVPRHVELSFSHF